MSIFQCLEIIGQMLEGRRYCESGKRYRNKD